MTLPIQVRIENIGVYMRGEKILLYIVARQDQAFVKLFSDSATPEDLSKLATRKPVQFDVSINKNLTTMYKGMTLPFYDFCTYTLIDDASIQHPKSIDE